MFQQVSSLALLALMSIVMPAPAMQIRGTISGNSVSKPKTLILIANPYSPQPGDSAMVVAIGTAARDRLEKSVATDFRVVTRKEMNDALLTFGYPPDAVLLQQGVQAMAASMGTRYYVYSNISRSAGNVVVTTRLVGSNIDVGHVVSVSGQPGQELGNRIADAVGPAVKALVDAKQCSDLADTKKDRAVEAANKALKNVPNFGLAEYCLAQISRKTDSLGAERMTHLENAVKGDPFSLVALSDISVIHYLKGDSLKTIETYQQMLRAAPTNRALLEQAFKLFLAFGKPDAAMAVADSGIKQDPTNTDWYDLKSNVCFAQGDNECAVRALTASYAADSSRADSTFFNKILFAASQKPDTAKYLEFAVKAVKRNPNNTGLLEELAKAYALTGAVDSTVAVTQRLIAVDPSKSGSVLGVVQQLLNAGKPREAIGFAPNIKQYGDEEAKNNFAGLVFQSMQKLVAAKPLDNVLLAEMAEATLSVGPTNKDIILYSNYFWAIGLQSGLSDLATSVRAQKSCELAKQEQTLLAKLEAAVTIAATSPTEAISSYAKRLLGSVQTEKPAVVQMIGSFCK